MCLQPFFVFIVAAKLLYTVSKCSRAEQVNNSRLFRMRDTSLPFSPCLSLFCFILRTYCIYSTVTPRSHSSARGLSLSSCLSLLSPICHCQLHLSLCLLEFISVTQASSLFSVELFSYYHCLPPSAASVVFLVIYLCLSIVLSIVYNLLLSTFLCHRLCLHLSPSFPNCFYLMSTSPLIK